MNEIPRELRGRMRAILAKLSLLHDVSGTSVVSMDGATLSQEKSKPPPETQLDRDTSKPPPKDRSLYAYYLYLFAKAEEAGNTEKIRLLCFLAERDHVRYLGRPNENPKARLAAQRRVSRPEDPQDEKATMQYVVDLYEGVDKIEVAVLEECSIGYIEKARRVHRRNEETGRPKAGWEGLTEEQRVAEIRRCRELRMSQAVFCQQHGVSLRTVQRYWGHGRAA